MLSIKQIGTICFAIFSFVFSAPSFADPDIPSSASTADCKNNPLQTYSGTSNLQANWQANTIQLHWYNGDTEITSGVPTSCTYDGPLNPPSTIPTRTGYTFKGWRVRQADTSCFASQVCSLTGSAVNGLTYNMDDSTARGYNSNNGQYSENASIYGLTSTGTWAVKDTSGGIVKGIASCNSTMPTIFETIMTAMGNGTMSEEQAIAAAYGSCASDAIKPGNTSFSSPGQYCWCKMSSYTPSGGSACNVASPSWVFYVDYGSASDCADNCALDCANGVMDYPVFRRALFGVSE